MSELIRFDPRRMQRGLAQTSRNLAGQFTSAQVQVERTNQRSLEWVQNRAAQELDEAIARHGRTQQFNSGRLRRAILDNRYHSADRDGFRFMIHQRVHEDVPYYRAIEEGDISQVGKTRVLGFFNGGQRVVPFASRGAPPRRLPQVVIRNPVPRYEYGGKAARAFLRSGIYKRYLRAEMAGVQRLGVDIR